MECKKSTGVSSWDEECGQEKASGRLCIVCLIALTLAGWVYAEDPTGPLPWTAPAVLNTDAAVDADGDDWPDICHDGEGTWGCAWIRSEDYPGQGSGIMFSRSQDDGDSWSSPQVLQWTSQSRSTGSFGPPRLAATSYGVWVCVWQTETLEGGNIGDDDDIVYSRSLDYGETWSEPKPLNSDATEDSCWDYDPAIATDNAGNWMVAWSKCGGPGPIAYTTSSNDGDDWSALQSVANLSWGNGEPSVATDCNDTWIIAWTSSDPMDDLLGHDNDILFCRSSDFGMTWSAPLPINNHAYEDDSFDSDGGPFEGCRILCNREGMWIAIWPSNYDLSSTDDDYSAFGDYDVLFSRSTDGGLTWSDANYLNSYAETDSEVFSDDDCDWAPPALAADRYGNWMAVWTLGGDLNGAHARQRTAMYAYSDTDGNDWQASYPIDASTYTQSGQWAHRASVSGNGNGTWISVWGTNTEPGDDDEILFSKVVTLIPDLVYSGGNGTDGFPHRIANAQDLIALGNDPGNYDKHFVLTSNIDLSGYDFDQAVIAPHVENGKNGFQGVPFSGSFDGNGHVIKNMKVIGFGFLGLFGQISSDAVVRNLGVENVVVGGDHSIGGIAGENHFASVINCYSTGIISARYSAIGGLVGVNKYGSVRNCHSDCEILGNNHLGGLLGLNYGNADLGPDCGRVTCCYSTGIVSGNENIGGLVGINHEGNVHNCYSTSVVFGEDTVGGLIGDNFRSIMSNCLSTGAVSGVSTVGGLVGYDYYCSVHFCFWDVDTSGQLNSDGGTGQTTAQLQGIDTYLNAGWDFIDETANGIEGVWFMPQSGYPELMP